MQKKKDLLRKPNQTVMITNKNISATQRKAYNIVLHQAWSELKKDNTKRSFYLSLADIKKKAGLKATDNAKLKKSLNALTTTGVEIVKNNGDWEAFALLSYAKKEGDLLRVDLPEPILKALIDNNFYTTLDLIMLKCLDCKYSVIFYEMAIRYSKMKIPEMTIQEVKELTGTTKVKSYENFARLKKNVLEPAMEEIHEKTDITLSYEAVKTGRKVTSINFKIEKKAEEISQKPSAKTQNQYYHDVKKKTINIPQHTNFKQRKHDDNYYDNLYENVQK